MDFCGVATIYEHRLVSFGVKHDTYVQPIAQLQDSVSKHAIWGRCGYFGVVTAIQIKGQRNAPENGCDWPLAPKGTSRLFDSACQAYYFVRDRAEKKVTFYIRGIVDGEHP